MRMRVPSLASLSGLKDLALLWLWCRPTATDPIPPLAWEPPCALGVALKNDVCVCVCVCKNNGLISYPRCFSVEGGLFTFKNHNIAKLS